MAAGRMSLTPDKWGAGAAVGVGGFVRPGAAYGHTVRPGVPTLLADVCVSFGAEGRLGGRQRWDTHV